METKKKMDQLNSTGTQPAPSAIFTALAWESAAVRSVLRQVERIDPRIWRGSTGNREALVITGGIGPRRTKETVERFSSTPFSAVIESVSLNGKGSHDLMGTVRQMTFAGTTVEYVVEMDGVDLLVTELGDYRDVPLDEGMRVSVRLNADRMHLLDS